MKILHVETGRHLYGGALQVLYLIKGLHANGIENTLVCPANSQIYKAAANFARCFAVNMRGDIDIRLLGALIKALRTENPDVIHAHSRRGADWWCGLASRLTGTPSIVTRRVDNPENRIAAKFKYRLFDRIVTISKAIRKILIQTGIERSKIDCIHSAVDYRRFQGRCDRQWFNRNFGLKPDHRPIGTIAQMIDRKGHRFLIEAMPAILNRHPRARFLFFGQGPLEAHLKALCTQRNLEGKVVFCGFRNDMERILPCLEIIVHPATMEGLGVALLQSAAAGKPIVAGNAGGIPEIVIHGVNGFITMPGDSKSIAHYVNLLLDDRKRQETFATAARQWALNHFTIENMVNQYLREYRGLLERLDRN